jgi:hypothetical protein
MLLFRVLPWKLPARLLVADALRKMETPCEPDIWRTRRRCRTGCRDDGSQLHGLRAKVADFHADGGDCAGAVVALVELDVEAVWPSLALVRGHWDVR